MFSSELERLPPNITHHLSDTAVGAVVITHEAHSKNISYIKHCTNISQNPSVQQNYRNSHDDVYIFILV